MEGPFVKDLMAFHQQFVDPKIRRVRLSVFATVSEFGLSFPHLKVAGVKHATRRGFNTVFAKQQT